jgi:hypothetical protein
MFCLASDLLYAHFKVLQNLKKKEDFSSGFLIIQPSQGTSEAPEVC